MKDINGCISATPDNIFQTLNAMRLMYSREKIPEFSKDLFNDAIAVLIQQKEILLDESGFLKINGNKVVDQAVASLDNKLL